DALADNRGYRNELFVHGDSKRVLAELADRLEGRLSVDPQFSLDLAAAREQAVASVAEGLGPYKKLVDTLQGAVGRDY
ncbi:hypothetical protein SB764_44650, partial [Paraburkholderia sp. SIMBA_027]